MKQSNGRLTDIVTLMPHAHSAENRQRRYRSDPATDVLDQFTITDPTGRKRVFRPKAAVLHVGRAAQNDISLDDHNVSRRHARLERRSDGWYITDLSSTNGTTVGTSELDPNVPTKLTVGGVIQIGQCSLVWQSVRQQTHTVSAEHKTMIMRAPAQPAPSEPQPDHVTAAVHVQATPEHVRFLPRESAQVSVTVTNEGPLHDTFLVECVGLPTKWVTLSTSTVSLAPGHSETIVATITTNDVRRAKPGTYSYHMRAISASDGTAAVTRENTLTIGQLEDISVAMDPARLEDGKEISLTLYNGGNTRIIYTVEAFSEQEPITAHTRNASYLLQPGSKDIVIAQISAEHHPILGRKRKVPFELRVNTDSGRTIRTGGELKVAPQVAWYWPVLAGLALTAASMLSVVLG